MCYNQTTSFVAFSVSAFFFIYLLYYGLKNNNKYDIYAAVVTILIGFMQLLEFFIWRSQDCSKINHYLSLLVIFLLYLQGIIACGTSMFLFTDLKINYFSYFISVVCIIFTIITFFTLKWLNKQHLCSRPSKNSCRLTWAPFALFIKNLKGLLYGSAFISFYFILLFTSIFIQIFSINKNLTQINLNYEFLKYPIRYLFLPITFLIAFLYSIYYEGISYADIFGSFWCFIAVGFGIVSALHI